MAHPNGLTALTLPNDVREAIADWRTWLSDERRASDHTTENYLADLYAFLGFIGGHLDGVPDLNALLRLNPRDFRSWLARRSMDGMAKTSTARALSSLRNFYRFLDHACPKPPPSRFRPSMRWPFLKMRVSGKMNLGLPSVTLHFLRFYTAVAFVFPKPLI